MEKRKIKRRGYSWKEKYEHAFQTYCSQFNHVLYYVGEKFGPEELDRYFAESMGKKVLGKAVFSNLRGKAVDTETFLRSYIPHHEMIGGEVKVVKAGPDEIIVDLERCGSKSMLAQKWGDMAKYYCRHCEVIRLWEELGWHSEVDKTRAKRLKGQNIGCRRIFHRIR